MATRNEEKSHLAILSSRGFYELRNTQDEGQSFKNQQPIVQIYGFRVTCSDLRLLLLNKVKLVTHTVLSA